MWQRVHLALVRGPEVGWVVELGAAGPGAKGPQVSIGRGAHADVTIADGALSRLHFTVRAGCSRLGRRGVWVHDAASANGTFRLLPLGVRRRARFVAVGGRIQAGGSVFEVRPDPRLGGPRRVGPALARAGPAAASAGFLAMILLPGAGLWPLAVAGLAGGASMLWRTARPAPLPDPAALLRSPQPRPGPPFRIDLGSGPRRGPASVEVEPGAVLAVVDAGPPARGAASGLARWIAAQLLAGYGPGAEANRPQVLLTDDPARVEPGPGRIVVVAAPASAHIAGATHIITAQAGHNRQVPEDWFHRVTRAGSGPALPHVAELGPLLPSLADLARTWPGHDGRLRAPVGVAASAQGPRPVVIDLAGDSPHAVIAGTTGAGKSEFLTAWLCGLATRYPPSHVSMVLIDYKGGATFGPLADLPHTLDVLTDLDHGATVRALSSLRVEILRRERALRKTGASSLVEHAGRCGPGEQISRLLVVVDEFRVLADEYPDVLDQLVRVAAQGRSLGIHVVLATQRPAMSADIRTNMGVRVCLRVVEETDSIDLLGSAAAAHLPAIPGRLILRTDATRTVQGLWAGDLVGPVVAACRSAAGANPDLGGGHRPWAPPLPARAEEVAPRPGHIAVGISDLPAQQRLGEWHTPVAASVLIAGGARSGRSNAAAVFARGLLAAGHPVHILAPAPLAAGPGIGTSADVGDHVTGYALLHRFLQGRAGRDALIIDDAAQLLRSLDEAGSPGDGAVLLGDVVRACRRAGAALVVTTDLPLPTWAEAFDERFIFPPPDPHQAALAGIRRELADPGPPGRAVALRGGEQTLVQIRRASGSPDGAATGAGAPRPAFQLRPVPADVDLPVDFAPAQPGAGGDAGGDAGGAVVIGRGGPRADPVLLACRPGQVSLVVGGPGSGKTRFTQVLGARLARARERAPARIVDDVHRLPPGHLDELAGALEQGVPLVATTTPEGIAGGFHPVLQRLRQPDQTLYLGALPRSLVGVDLGPYIAAGIPGRGVLHTGGRFIPVQLDRCSQVPG